MTMLRFSATYLLAIAIGTLSIDAAIAQAPTPTELRAQSPSSTSTDIAAYCADLKRVAALAASNDRFASITGNPRHGSFLDTTLPLTGWRDCSLYGAGTYTCDWPVAGSAQAAEKAQADLVRTLKTCLGEEWSEAADQSSAKYVILRHGTQPVSITLSVDQTDDNTHVVHLILFVRRRSR